MQIDSREVNSKKAKLDRNSKTLYFWIENVIEKLTRTIDEINPDVLQYPYAMNNDNNITDQSYYPYHTNRHLGSMQNRALMITNPVIHNIPIILSDHQPPKNNRVNVILTILFK